jgi:hypothetical protein
MDGVYALDFAATEERRGQYVDRERGHDGVRDVVGMRIVGDGKHRREVGQITVHGVPAGCDLTAPGLRRGDQNLAE